MKTYRNINKINLEYFTTDIITATSLNYKLIKTLTDLLKNLLDKDAPLKTNSFTEHNLSPWFNSDLHKKMRIQNNKPNIHKIPYTYELSNTENDTYNLS